MTTIKPGDEVCLKSGGPMMTVSDVEDDVAVCIWFESKKQNVNRFRLVTLVHKDDLPSAPSMVMGGIFV
jgi:uncharacterized protein YodC (DUF2158 family)